MEQESKLILSQYKVIRILEMQENYAAVQAVDILDRQQPMCLLNIYEGDYVKEFAPVFDQIHHCNEYLGMHFDHSTLIAIFQWKDKPTIDQKFYGGAKENWETRLGFAESLVRLVLRLWDQPVELGCAVLKNKNLCVMPQDQKFVTNFIIAPTTEGLSKRELICLAGDQMAKVLRDDKNVVIAERKFVMELRGGRWKDAISLNSAWNEVKEDIKKAHKAISSESFLKSLWKKIKKTIEWNNIEKRSIYGKKK